MKHVKKVFAFLLIALLVLSLSAVAFADGDEGGEAGETGGTTSSTATGSVTVNNAIPGEKYNIYKVFDLTYSGEGQTTTEGSTTTSTAYEGVSYTYTKTGDSDELYSALTSENSPFTLTATTTANVYNVAVKEGKTAEDIASFLKTNQSKLPSAGTEATAPAAVAPSTTSTVSWTGLDFGYYYVTSSVGSTVTIDSTLKDVVVEDKNSVPGENKKQSTSEDGTYTDDELNVSIGDTVYYQVTITDGKGTDKDLFLTDTMSSGLTFNESSLKIYKGSVVAANEVAKTAGEPAVAQWSLVEKADGDTWTFKIKVEGSYMATLNESDTLIVCYNAVLNENAITESEEGENKNTSDLDYSNQHQTDSVEVTTMKFQIVKDDKNNKLLTGAKFRLYDQETGGNEIKVVKVSDGVYRLAKSGEDGVEIEAGTPVIRGIKAGTYWLEETEAPAGYNKLTSRAQVVVSAASTTTSTEGGTETTTKTGGDNMATFKTTTTDNDTYDKGGIEVENNSGTELPSTGGIGTTIFYVVGGVLVLGAVVLLITKKRVSREG
ncbi:MAG: LPXTG cell wall anchor domain-containing protein [Oscillospiraceae bacterium]|nr:LPXTG cell wall anchor domain-containing protein [Oscillospiraceae bacterium]